MYLHIMPSRGRAGEEATVDRPTSGGLECQTKEFGLYPEGTGETWEDLNSSNKVKFVLWKGASRSYESVMWDEVVMGDKTTRKKMKEALLKLLMQKWIFTDS